jgi:hypothetical protein
MTPNSAQIFGSAIASETSLFDGFIVPIEEVGLKIPFDFSFKIIDRISIPYLKQQFNIALFVQSLHGLLSNLVPT